MRKSFLLRISPELYKSLEAWAAQELRSVNSQIELILRQAVARQGRGVGEGREAGETFKSPPSGDRSEP
jgi:hypothetical protein